MTLNPENLIDLKSLANNAATSEINADLAGQPAAESAVRWTPEYAASGAMKTVPAEEV